MGDLGLTDSLGTAYQQPSQQQGWLGGLGSLLSHPLVQSALATYFGAISSPRRLGLGAAIGQGGLAGLGQYGQALQSQQEAAKLGLEQQQLQQQIGQQQRRERAIQGLPADIRNYAEIDPSFVGEIAKQHIITQANKGALDSLAIAYKNDPQASALIGAYYGSPAAVDLGKVVETIQKVKTGDLDIRKALVDIQKGQTDIEKTEGEIGMQPLEAAAKQADISLKGVEAGKDVAETAKARAEIGTEGMEHVTIRKIGDPTQTQIMSYRKGTTFTPPPGTEIVTGGEITTPKDPTTMAHTGLENLGALETQRTKARPWSATVGEFFSGDKAAANRRQYAISHGINPVTGKALPKLGAGWKLGEIDLDGTIHAIDPNGNPHHWED